MINTRKICLSILGSLLFCCNIQAQAFEDVSEQIGFNHFGLNSGMTIGDINGDGFEDIYVCRKDLANLLFINQGDFNFVESAQESGLAFEGNSRASIMIDYDNDGDLDVFLANIFEPCKLFQNQDGYFTDITVASNVNVVGIVQSVHATDFDNDGDLDIYITRTLEQNVLLKNEGDHFIDYTDQSGIFDDGHSMGAIFFDYDNDGDQDLYQTRDFDDGNLFFENENGVFVDATEKTGTGYKGHGMGVDVTDVNQDGLLDLYFTNLYDNVLYIQNEQRHFDPVDETELKDPGMGWGTFFFDANNNGKQDIYLANDSNFSVNGNLYSNKLIINNGELNFYAPAFDDSINNMLASYGAAFSDFDLDGRLDFVVANRGGASNQIFRNTSNFKNYLAVELEGIESNKQGVGAKVTVESGSEVWVDTKTCGSGYASQSTAKLHFGLNENTSVERVIVQWPSGNESIIENPDINQTIKITENNLNGGSGVVVWTEPEFPTQLDNVTVYFDAAEGNGALAGFSSAVYAHTGVITSQSTAPNDWKHVQGNWGTADPNVLMNAEGDDVYSLSYNISDYYGIEAGEVVEKLAFVFRNADGSIVGRAEDGSDIFHDVYDVEDGLLANLISPSNDNVIIFENESLPINLTLNKPADISIFDNGNLIFEENTSAVNFAYEASGLGLHTLDFQISDGVDQIEITRRFLIIDPDKDRVDPPEGTISGINYPSGSSYIFSLVAPNKSHAFLLCPENAFRADPNYRMTKSDNGDVFWLELPTQLFSEGKNCYQYLVDGQIKIADPYSKVVLDPWNDDDVPQDVMDDLPSYPETMTTGIVTAFDQVEENYPWQNLDFNPPAKTDLVIYEIMMRDFLSDKNYKSLLDTLDYIESLGINAIELMPIQEFEGNQSWGYNPSFHMAVDKYYGSRNQLKSVIDECHSRGIAVILDVVFNHAFSQSPLCQMFWDPAEFRPAADNPWLNETAKHPFNVGYDFNHESHYTQAWVKQVLSYWIEEFKFDGFRFDLSKGLTQTFSGNNASIMSQYDQSRIDILSDYADHIWSIDENSYVILEHFANNSEERVLSDMGMMLWGNATYDYAEAAMGYNSNLAWSDYTEREWNDPHLIAYMESHDEERLAYKIKTYGDSNGSYDTKSLDVLTERIVAATALYMSIPGPKMLWQFGEIGYDFSINRCVDGSINSNCRLDPKPIRWDYLEDDYRIRAYEKISAINYLKSNFPSFSTSDFDFDDGDNHVKVVHLFHEEMDVVTVVNFNTEGENKNIAFPSVGTWYDYLSGETIDIESANQNILLNPGEYRIYTSEYVEPPNGVFTSTIDWLTTDFSFSPNPVYPLEQIFISTEEMNQIDALNLIDQNGNHMSLEHSIINHGISSEIPELSPGVYVLELIQSDQRSYSKIIIL